jgi:hypothetical protein
MDVNKRTQQERAYTLKPKLQRSENGLAKFIKMA